MSGGWCVRVTMSDRRGIPVSSWLVSRHEWRWGRQATVFSAESAAPRFLTHWRMKVFHSPLAEAGGSPRGNCRIKERRPTYDAGQGRDEAADRGITAMSDDAVTERNRLIGLARRVLGRGEDCGAAQGDGRRPFRRVSARGSRRLQRGRPSPPFVHAADALPRRFGLLGSPWSTSPSRSGRRCNPGRAGDRGRHPQPGHAVPPRSRRSPRSRLFGVGLRLVAPDRQRDPDEDGGSCVTTAQSRRPRVRPREPDPASLSTGSIGPRGRGATGRATPVAVRRGAERSG